MIEKKEYKYYDLIMASFVTVLLCSNLIGPAKIVEVTLPFTILGIGDSLKFGAGNIFFPISYIFGDILTEVYGYARARKVIWMGFAGTIFAAMMAQIILLLPPSPDEPYNNIYQPAIEIVFGAGGRIVLASILAYWMGDFANSLVMAKLKIFSKGKFLWVRTIGSTIVGQGIDSFVFYPIAFAGIWETSNLLSISLFNWNFKVIIEIIMTPVTYKIVGFLKKAENEDYYDKGTNFTPFSLKT